MNWDSKEETYEGNRSQQLDELQGVVCEWAERTFPDHTDETILIHLGREIDELEKCDNMIEVADCAILELTYVGRHGRSLRMAAWPLNEATLGKDGAIDMLRTRVGQLRDGGYDSPKAASIWLCLEIYAHYLGGDLLKAIEEKHRINLTRIWGPKDIQGVREHVRGSLA